MSERFLQIKEMSLQKPRECFVADSRNIIRLASQDLQEIEIMIFEEKCVDKFSILVLTQKGGYYFFKNHNFYLRMVVASIREESTVEISALEGRVFENHLNLRI